MYYTKQKRVDKDKRLETRFKGQIVKFKNDVEFKITSGRIIKMHYST